MNEKALEGRDEVLGPKHLDTLTSLSNLALIFKERKLLEKAEEMHWRAL